MHRKVVPCLTKSHSYKPYLQPSLSFQFLTSPSQSHQGFIIQSPQTLISSLSCFQPIPMVFDFSLLSSCLLNPLPHVSLSLLPPSSPLLVQTKSLSAQIYNHTALPNSFIDIYPSANHFPNCQSTL